MGMNRINLVGRLTKDSELKYTPNGVAVCSFTLAVDRNFKNAQGEREADFIPVVVYRQLAELCAEYLSKGKLAGIDGRLQVRTYDAQDGQRRWVYEVVADNVQFLSPKDKDSTHNDNSRTYGSAANKASSPSSDHFLGYEVSLDDDIPF
ncbi:single-stranded DNA-binding protein [Desulfitobacterium chlororespirans]|uniref:Single-stranded DNA-binding protein n=1 Tax=Desulfitobacterium chlororespirans DSM 11544 TaxID=1121395 RepID=A0A1M7UU68_9FIRM|nr:single-stranded DNA-binding protein [Desulfitobacterium chlororespirans]SHN86436.1 single-strand binding protein [Desulfitobacterium chlororespirans DSM 11544]